MVLPQNARRLLVTGDIVRLRLFRYFEDGYIAQDFARKTDTEHLSSRDWSAGFIFDVHSEAPSRESSLDEPFPALILLSDNKPALSFRRRKTGTRDRARDGQDIGESEENDKKSTYMGRTFLLLLRWDGEVAERRALIAIESELLANADRERREFYLV